jgi:hypothetical protein
MSRCGARAMFGLSQVAEQFQVLYSDSGGQFLE